MKWLLRPFIALDFCIVYVLLSMKTPNVHTVSFDVVVEYQYYDVVVGLDVCSAERLWPDW